MIEILADIPFELETSALLKKAHVEPGSEDAAAFEALLGRALVLARPKAVYKESYVTARGDATVALDGVTFTSRVLHQNLAAVERVFPYVATCGREVDQVDHAADDFLEPYWLDMIKAALLACSLRYVKDTLDRRFALGKTSAMSPGSGDATVWPIEQQRELFALLEGATTSIGVELTDSFLMVPNKTVSGIRFLKEVDFRSCQLCQREVCPSRSAAFDSELWASSHDS